MTVSSAEAIRLLDEELGPVLEAVGFAPAQYCDGDDASTAIYCAALQTIRDRVPGIPDGHEPELSGTECFDVTVEVSGDRLVDVHTDGGSLHDVLEDMGLTAGARMVARATGSPVADARWALARALAALFAAT